MYFHAFPWETRTFPATIPGFFNMPTLFFYPLLNNKKSHTSTYFCHFSATKHCFWNIVLNRALKKCVPNYSILCDIYRRVRFEVLWCAELVLILLKASRSRQRFWELHYFKPFLTSVKNALFVSFVNLSFPCKRRLLGPQKKKKLN